MEQEQKPERFRMQPHRGQGWKADDYLFVAIETLSAQLDYGLDLLDYLIGLEQERRQKEVE